jgi:hypothetical protein
MVLFSVKLQADGPSWADGVSNPPEPVKVS